MLELRDISAGYSTGLVLRNIDLTVPDGSVVAILGPNGAGKTTLLRVMSGLIRPTAGDMILDGEVVTNAAPHDLARRGVCHIPEGRGIYGSLTVEENIRLQAPAGDKSAIEEVVSVFPRLGERLGQIAGSLSGGEQQMLAMSRAYVGEPSVVLLDEVSMGLAPLIVDEIFEHLDRLARSGTTLAIVEQYVDRALNLADYVYVIVRGQVAFAGESFELSADSLSELYLETT